MGLPMTDDELVFELSRNDVVSCRIKYADGRVNVGHGLLLEAVGLIHRERAESARLRAEVQRLRDALKPFAAIDLTTNQAVDAKSKE